MQQTTKKKENLIEKLGVQHNSYTPFFAIPHSI